MKRILLSGIGAAALAIAYLAGVAVTRYKADRDLQQRLDARTAQKYRGAGANTGTDVKILQFYAGNGEVDRGDHTVVCYGVENARSVRLDPPIEQIEPSLNRCIAVTPQRTTEFKLMAAGRDGREVSEAFTVKVNPAPPRILFIDLSSGEVKRGEMLTMCYGVKNAAEVRFAPMGWKLEPREKNCRMWYPVHTFKYTLTALSAEGRKDQETFTIRVK